MTAVGWMKAVGSIFDIPVSVKKQTPAGMGAGDGS